MSTKKVRAPTDSEFQDTSHVGLYDSDKCFLL